MHIHLGNLFCTIFAGYSFPSRFTSKLTCSIKSVTAVAVLVTFVSAVWTIRTRTTGLSMLNYWQWNLVPTPLSSLFFFCMFSLKEHIINEQEEFVVIMYDRSSSTNRVNDALLRQSHYSTIFLVLKTVLKTK